MAHASYLREKARSMRVERQFTIDQLAERLALSRSTIYYWVRDLPRVETPRGAQRQEAARRRGSRTMQRRYRLLREQAYREGLAEFDGLAADPTFRDFVCLYVAEGYKRDRNIVSVANSDPAVIQLADRWVRRSTHKPPAYWVQYHADQSLQELRKFWGGMLDTDPDSIRMQRKSNSNQLTGRIWRCRHGVLTVRVCDTRFRARMQAWMDRLRSEWQ
jgi:transcriptional regulator with XRE-family HTH domain